MADYRFDTSHLEWREVTGEPELSYKLHYDYSVLGWDLENGTIDFVLRFPGDGGHCQRHRHLANTAILVLEGEQHLDDLHKDGSSVHRMRHAGEYSRSSGPEELPHMERGGTDGALVFYGCHAPDGRLFEFLDDDLNVITEVTIENLIDDWQAR
jgi:hypothetical protein